MESDKEPLSFGHYLQSIRLEKKIGLEQISEQTRIGLGNLLLIEQEDHERLPAAVYVKGFLRAYAATIGADGDEAIRRYEAQLDVVRPKSDSKSASKGIDPKMRWKILVSLLLLICIIGFSVFAVLLFRHVSNADKPAEPGVAAEKEPAAETRSRSGRQDTETDSEPTRTVPEKLMLQVTALEDTWLKVIIDEMGSAEHNLRSGDQIELEAATGFNLLIGNAGGVRLTLNDKPVIIHGKSGEVVTIHLP